MRVLTDLATVAGVIAELSEGRGRTLIGIAGSPGAGKSTIASKLVTLLGPSAGLLPMDGFHLPQARLVELGRRERMGAPDTFDVESFVATLGALRAAGPVVAPGFDRDIEEPIPGAIVIAPELRTVVVEGNYLLADSGGWEGVAPLLDASFFVELDRDIRLQRLVARHVAFGKRPDAAAAWAGGPDERNARLIEATATRATHRIRLPSDA